MICLAGSREISSQPGVTSSCVQKTKPKQGSYLLIRRDQSSDVVALRVLVDELDVANQQFARRLGFLEAILYTFVGRDRLFFSVDELECVDETVRRNGPASEDHQGIQTSPPPPPPKLTLAQLARRRRLRS